MSDLTRYLHGLLSTGQPHAGLLSVTPGAGITDMSAPPPIMAPQQQRRGGIGDLLSLPGNVISAYAEGYRDLPGRYRDAAEQRRIAAEEHRQAMAYINTLPPEERAIALANLPEWAAQRARQYAPQVVPRGGMVTQGAVNSPGFQTAQPAVQPNPPPFGLTQDQQSGQVSLAPGYADTQTALANARRPTADQIAADARARQSARPPPRTSGSGVGHRRGPGRVSGAGVRSGGSGDDPAW